MKKNLDITKPRYCKQILPVPWLVTWRFFFKCITITWVIKRVCYTLWTSLNRGFHCITFSFQLLTDLGPWPVPHLCWSTTYISFLNHIIFCLILLFQHGSSLLFAVGFLTRSLFATMILTAATNSLLVSPVAYNPETSKFPIFTCLEKCWVFYF